MTKEELHEAIKSTKDGITKALIENAIKDGSREDQALDPFMYAGCIVAAAISAWTRMIVCIQVTNKKAIDPKEIERELRRLIDATITDTMGSITIIEETIKTK